MVVVNGSSSQCSFWETIDFFTKVSLQVGSASNSLILLQCCGKLYHAVELRIAGALFAMSCSVIKRGGTIAFARIFIRLDISYRCSK